MQFRFIAMMVMIALLAAHAEHSHAGEVAASELTYRARAKPERFTLDGQPVFESSPLSRKALQMTIPNLNDLRMVRHYEIHGGALAMLEDQLHSDFSIASPDHPQLYPADSLQSTQVAPPLPVVGVPSLAPLAEPPSIARHSAASLLEKLTMGISATLPWREVLVEALPAVSPPEYATDHSTERRNYLPQSLPPVRMVKPLRLTEAAPALPVQMVLPQPVAEVAARGREVVASTPSSITQEDLGRITNLAPAPAAPATPDKPQTAALMDLAPAAGGELPPELERAMSATLAAQANVPISPAPEPQSSEPPMTLSPESKKTLSRIPSHIDTPTPSERPGPISIARSKEAAEILASEESTASEEASHEAMGIKIQIKAPTMTSNYQLEKAYSAVLSGQPEQAMELYKDILRQDPANADALFGVAAIYHRSGQLDKARGYYSRLLNADPDHRDGLNNFLALVSEEAPEEALGKLSSLEQRNPEFSPIPAQMALIYQRSGQVDKAMDKMLRAVSLAPENLTYRYNLAILMDKQGKREEAASLYRQLLEASRRGEALPGKIEDIQQRLTFLRSNN